MARTPGTVIAGRYRLARKLGTGGAGQVWAAEDQVLRREVALKLLHVATGDGSRRFEREARLGARLRHPNLVEVYDVLEADHEVVLVMELVEGQSLAEVLEGGPLGAQRTVAVVSAVAAALEHAHAHGVVHRDVKPSNILVGVDGRVRLADLGIAIAAAATRITRPGDVLGTPAYLAPEVLDGSDATPAADVYALGAVAYECLTARAARYGRNAYELLDRIRTQPPPRLRETLPDAPAAADELLERAMAREPAQRPASAEALARSLAAALDPPAPAAAPPAPVARRPVRWWPAAALAAVAAAVLAIVLTSGGGSRPRAAATPTATPTARAARTPTPTPRAAVTSDTPAGAVRGFYAAAARHDFARAWALAGPGMRAQFGSEAELARQLGSLERIAFARLTVASRSADRAILDVQTVAVHTDRTDHCHGTLAAVRVGGRWRAEPNGLSCVSG